MPDSPDQLAQAPADDPQAAPAPDGAAPDGSAAAPAEAAPAKRQAGSVAAPYWMTSGFEYGGFWIRFAAKFLDILVLLALFVVSVATIVLLLVYPIVLLGYFPFFWSRSATPGQRICGLRVVRAGDGSPISLSLAIGRFVVELTELLSMVILVGFFGFVLAAFDRKKRAWHDIAVGTVVVHAQLYELYED
jgi:uncharacterized RDD family membrane protein YckC